MICEKGGQFKSGKGCSESGGLDRIDDVENRTTISYERPRSEALELPVFFWLLLRLSLALRLAPE